MTRGARVTSVLFHFSFETESAKSLPETHIYSCIFRRRTSNASPHLLRPTIDRELRPRLAKPARKSPLRNFDFSLSLPFPRVSPTLAAGVAAGTDSYYRLLTYSTLDTKSATPFSSSRRSARPRTLSAPTTLRATSRGRPFPPHLSTSNTTHPALVFVFRPAVRKRLITQSFPVCWDRAAFRAMWIAPFLVPHDPQLAGRAWRVPVQGGNAIHEPPLLRKYWSPQQGSEAWQDDGRSAKRSVSQETTAF